MVNKIFNLFDSLFNLFYTKKYESKSILNKKINDVFISFFLFIIISFSIGLILFGINNLIDKYYGINLYTIRANNIQSLLNSQTLKPILIIGVIGPIFEETLFRLWLSFKKIDVAISASFFIFYLAVIVICNKSLYSIGVTTDLMLPFFISVIFFIVLKRYLNPIVLSKCRAKYWMHFVGISSVLFASVHLKNFTPFHFNIIWAYLFFVLPQFFMGLLLSYIRLKNGFYWALLLHCLVNSFSILITA